MKLRNKAERDRSSRGICFFFKRCHKRSVNVCYTACSSLCTALFQRFFAWRSRRTRWCAASSRSSINQSAVVKMQNADRIHLRIATRTCDPEARVGEREQRWAEPPTRDRPRICKRSFQLTATMAWRIGRCAANSKPIRRVHARKSSTSSAPNTSRRTGLIPRDHAVRTDVYRGGYLRRNCAMSLTGLHFAQTNLCFKQYGCSTKK